MTLAGPISPSPMNPSSTVKLLQKEIINHNEAFCMAGPPCGILKRQGQ